MSADDLPELPPDAREALADAKRLEGPGDDVRARMRARLAAALPPPPDGGDGGDGDGGGGGEPAGGAGALGALPKVPLWVAALALVAGAAGGLLYPRAPIERVVVMPGPPLVVSPSSAPVLPLASASPAPSSVRTIDMKDLPLLPAAVPDAGPARGDDLAAERAALDVARTALGRGDGANALAACEDHAKKYPRGALAEEREAIAVQALVLEHRTDDARARAERFRKTHPRSILLPAVLAAAGIEP